MKPVILLLGPAGGGKGATAKALLQVFPNFGYISTGDLSREEVAKTNLGGEAEQRRLTIDAQMKAPGGLVDTAIINELFFERLIAMSNNPEIAGIIIDGYSRTPEQAAMLDTLLSQHEMILIACLEMQKELELCVKHMTVNRVAEATTLKIPIRNEDADETAARAKVQKYFTDIIHVRNYYAGQGKLFPINANQELNIMQLDAVKVVVRLMSQFQREKFATKIAELRNIHAVMNVARWDKPKLAEALLFFIEG